MEKTWKWLGLALMIGALSMGGTMANAEFVAAQEDRVAFDLVVPDRPFGYLPDALPDAAGAATVASSAGVDQLDLMLTGLPASAAFNIFLTEFGAPPFGAIQYLADIETDGEGAASVTVRTALRNAFALRGIAANGQLDPAATNDTRVDLDHIVVWPKEPETMAFAFAEPVMTLFDDDGAAGPAVLTTAIDDGAGPLAVETAVSDADTATKIVVRQHPDLGELLTDAKGMTLYRFTNDGPNESTCDGECAANWPAFAPGGQAALALGLPGELGTIARADGTEQSTYNGMPLYYFAGDQAPGDVNGQGVGDVWFIVEPAAP